MKKCGSILEGREVFFVGRVKPKLNRCIGSLVGYFKTKLVKKSDATKFIGLSFSSNKTIEFVTFFLSVGVVFLTKLSIKIELIS